MFLFALHDGLASWSFLAALCDIIDVSLSAKSLSLMTTIGSLDAMMIDIHYAN